MQFFFFPDNCDDGFEKAMAVNAMLCVLVGIFQVSSLALSLILLQYLQPKNLEAVSSEIIR